MPKVLKKELRFVTNEAPVIYKEGRKRFGPGQSFAALGLMAVLLTGCAEVGPPVGAVGHVQQYFGGIAADEPRAALVGRDVLSAGGSAGDAAVAMAFTMMVTRPDAAGPGGGGVCVYYSREKNQAETIEFLPRPASASKGAGGRAGMVPGTFRGLFALHARYGRLRWETLVFPAEKMARFGIPFPRILVSALSGSGRRILDDPRAGGIYRNPAGRVLREGDTFTQLGLAGVLGRIRSVGPGDFHSGVLARRYVEAVTASGVDLTIDDMRAYLPRWSKTVQFEAGNHVLHLPDIPTSGALIAGEIWRRIGNRNDYAKADEAGKARLLAAAAQQAYEAAGLAGSSVGASRGASAGLLAMDVNGDAVSCVLTMVRPFGSGRIAGETGIIPVPLAGPGSALSIAAAVVANHNGKFAVMAATGAGDGYAGPALASVMMRVLDGDGDADLEKILTLPRVAVDGAAGEAVVESTAPPAVMRALSGGGARTVTAPVIGNVNAMNCPEGVVAAPLYCVVRADPRSYSHAVNSEF